MNNNDRVTAQVNALIAAAERACDESACSDGGVLASGPGFSVRCIVLNMNEEIPFSRAMNRTKTWALVSGRGHADIGEVERQLGAGDVCIIPPGHLHQIENRYADPLVLIETSVAFKSLSSKSLPKGLAATTRDRQSPSHDGYRS